MPKLETSRKHFSEVITNTNKNKLHRNMNESSALILVTDAATRDTMGLAVVWDDANSTFVPYTGQDIATISAGNDSTLPDGSPVAITTGSKRGDAKDQVTDVDLTAGVNLCGYYRNAEACAEGIDMPGATEAQRDAFIKQLEKQGVSVATAATSVDPKYV